VLLESCEHYFSDDHSGSVANHSVPSELKLAYPGGKVRASCGNALGYASPSFMGDAVRAPGWWNTTDVMSTLNSILAEKASITRKADENAADDSLPSVEEADLHATLTQW
jgi:hypothetical protein